MRPPTKHPFKQAYESTCKTLLDTTPKVTRLRGNILKRALLIAPSPDEDECKMNLPLANDTYAKALHRYMAACSELSTQDDFVVMAGCPLMGAKPTKKAIEPFRDMLQEQRECFDLIVCIGSTNFKFYFGRGKKSSLQTLANGQPVFLTFDWPKLPLFVLPDIQLLSPPYTGDRNVDWKIENLQRQAEKWFERILPGLGKTYRTYVK